VSWNFGAEQVLVWSLTYAVHSTLLLGGAWWLVRRGWPRGRAARAGRWRAPRFGAVVSRSAQSFAALPSMTVRAEVPTLLVEAALPTLQPLPDGPPGLRSGALSAPAEPSAEELALLREFHERRARAEAALAVRRWMPVWLLSLAGGWLVLRSLLAQRALGQRRELRDGPWREQLDDLCRSANVARRVRLTVSTRLHSPVALGVLRPEICLPERALEDLPAPLRRPALAHELGHLVRLDPLWLGLVDAVRSGFAWQPLNRLAARELAREAELGADAWAARVTGDRFGLARCLTEVAGWLGERRQRGPLEACAMLRDKSALERRVQRLIAKAQPEARARRVALGTVAGLVLAGLCLPGWSLATLEGSAEAAPARSAEIAHDVPAEARLLRLRTELGDLFGQLADLESRTQDSSGGLAHFERTRHLTARARAVQAEVDSLLTALEGGAR
jgi:beta-lactamase regulating signal transducer with metallopeptidase domain